MPPELAHTTPAVAQRTVLAAAIHDRISGIGGDAHRAHQERDAVAAGWDLATFRARVNAAVTAALGGAPKMSQAMQLMTSQQTDEWYTPAWVLDLARRILGGIDLDPASSDVAQRTVQATRYYTQADDGYSRPWFGRVWLNPPFTEAERWAKRLAAAYTDGDVAAGLLLVNSAPGYNWYEALVDAWPAAQFRKRLSFVRADGQPAGLAKKSQTLVFFGPEPAHFAAETAPHCRLLTPLAGARHVAPLFEVAA